jgi:hypothetical protein
MPKTSKKAKKPVRKEVQPIYNQGVTRPKAEDDNQKTVLEIIRKNYRL